jgi:hypothetical protein
MERITYDYSVMVTVHVTGKEGLSDEEFDKAAQNAANDINAILANRTINTAGCDIAYEVE